MKRTFDGHDLDFDVSVEKISSTSLLFDAADTTIHGSVARKDDLRQWYASEHSPIRTQMFYIRVRNIPHFVHTHYVRHTVWNQPYVRTGREDRGAQTEQGRWSPVDMDLLVNAQTLINMARKRLCTQAHRVTTWVMEEIKAKVAELDPDLARNMVRECVYRNGFCPQFKSCGFVHKDEIYRELEEWYGDIKNMRRRSTAGRKTIFNQEEK